MYISGCVLLEKLPRAYAHIININIEHARAWREEEIGKHCQEIYFSCSRWLHKIRDTTVVPVPSSPYLTVCVKWWKIFTDLENDSTLPSFLRVYTVPEMLIDDFRNIIRITVLFDGLFNYFSIYIFIKVNGSFDYNYELLYHINIIRLNSVSYNSQFRFHQLFFSFSMFLLSSKELITTEDELIPIANAEKIGRIW